MTGLNLAIEYYWPATLTFFLTPVLLFAIGDICFRHHFFIAGFLAHISSVILAYLFMVAWLEGMPTEGPMMAIAQITPIMGALIIFLYPFSYGSLRQWVRTKEPPG